MLGILVVLGDCNFFNNRKKSVGKMLVLGFYRLGNTVVFCVQLITIGLNHFGRQNVHTHISCLGILGLHYKVFLKISVFVEIFFKQVRSNEKGEQITLFLHHLHSVLYIFSPALARGEKLVVPDSYITTARDIMYNPHQLVGVAAVLLSVAQEHVCVESRSDTLHHLIRDKYCLEGFL